MKLLGGIEAIAKSYGMYEQRTDDLEERCRRAGVVQSKRAFVAA